MKSGANNRGAPHQSMRKLIETLDDLILTPNAAPE